MEESTQNNAFNLKDLLTIIVRRKWVVLTFFVVLVTVVVIGTLNQTPIYRAATTIAIAPDSPKVLNFQHLDEIGASNYWMYQDYYNTQNQIIRSNRIAQLVVDRLGLTTENREGEQVSMPSGMLISNLDVVPIPESQLVRIAYEHPDPEQASTIANTIAQVYIDDSLNQRIDTTRQAVDWLSERLDELKSAVVKSEQKMYEFRSENQLIGLDERHNLVMQKLVDLNTAYAKTRTARIELEARWDRLNNLIEGGADREAIAQVLASQLVQNLKQQQIDLERERKNLEARYLPEHPQLIRLLDQVDYVGARIDHEISRIIESARHDYLLKMAEEESLSKELEASKREALNLHKKMVNHMAIQQETEKNQELYDVLLGRLKEADLTSSLRSQNLRVVDTALTPAIPVRPVLRINLALAALVGLVGGVGLAFLLDYMDNTIKTQEDVERYVQLPLLGIIPGIEEGEADNPDLHVHLHPQSTIAEGCRSIRTNLLFMGVERPLRSLLVTSATPLEGKSTTCCNLGITMAQAGQRVLIVDTDLRRSRLHKTFAIDNQLGFSNLLLGEDDVDLVARASGIPNLWVIPSGPLPPNPSELLSSPRMDTVVARLMEQFDLVIFDSPPIMPVTDAIVISRKVEGTIYVVKAGKVSRDVVTEARKRLGDVQPRLLGAILNAVDINVGGYSYQYQYQYSSRTADGEEQS